MSPVTPSTQVQELDALLADAARGAPAVELGIAADVLASCPYERVRSRARPLAQAFALAAEPHGDHSRSLVQLLRLISTPETEPATIATAIGQLPEIPEQGTLPVLAAPSALYVQVRALERLPMGDPCVGRVSRAVQLGRNRPTHPIWRRSVAAGRMAGREEVQTWGESVGGGMRSGVG